MLLARYGCPMGQKALFRWAASIHAKYGKNMAKTAKKCIKLGVNHQNITNFSQWVCFSDVSVQANHFKGL